MTNEEAANRLFENWYISTNGNLCVDEEERDAFCEAIGVAVKALRAQQPPLNRNRWEARPITKQRPYRSEKFKEVKLSEDGEVLYRKVVTIHEDWTDDYCSACGKKLCSRFTSYCPNCGRPLTEKAWTELERRINDA